MYDTITPEERLERVARLLVKAMYLSLDEEKAVGGNGFEYTVERERMAGGEGAREHDYAAGQRARTRRYGAP